MYKIHSLSNNKSLYQMHVVTCVQSKSCRTFYLLRFTVFVCEQHLSGEMLVRGEWEVRGGVKSQARRPVNTASTASAVKILCTLRNPLCQSCTHRNEKPSVQLTASRPRQAPWQLLLLVQRKGRSYVKKNVKILLYTNFSNINIHQILPGSLSFHTDGCEDNESPLYFSERYRRLLA